MTTVAREIAIREFEKHGGGLQGWQAAADAVTAHEREAVEKHCRERGLLTLAEQIHAGHHHVPPRKTPGQVLRERLGMHETKAYTDAFLEGVASAILDHAKESR